MKKNEKATENKATKEIFNSVELDFNTIDSIISRAVTDGKTTKYPLCGGVTLCITDSDKDYDFGFLCVYGIYINITFRTAKTGKMFVSYPSVKTTKGEYKNVVTNYSKSFNEIISQVVARHYGV